MIFITIALTFIPAAFSIFVVKEREVGAKHQQVVSGVGVLSYWTATYLWDIVSHAIPATMSTLVVASFGLSEFTDDGATFGMFALFMLYGTAVAPFVYIITFPYKSHSTAQNAVLMQMFCLGLVLYITYFALAQSASTKELSESLVWVFRLSPLFCVANGMSNLSFRRVHNQFKPDDQQGVFDSEQLGDDLLVLTVLSVVYFLLTLVIEYASSLPAIRALCVADPAVQDDTYDVDEDVRNESIRVSNSAKRGETLDLLSLSGSRNPVVPCSEPSDASSPFSSAATLDRPSRACYEAAEPDDAIVITHLRKVYGTGARKPYTCERRNAKVAVRDLSFGVPLSQCFGFLGINGAGKTTTLKMLTGDVTPTSGTAKLGGYDIRDDLKKVQMQIGYCPQFDALFDLLTTREHLELYARIKCIPERNIRTVVDRMLSAMDLLDFETKLAGSLSGGNKRKLSVGIAMIGSPRLVLLDEPSTGMDPVSRRFMWDVISRLSSGGEDNPGCAVVLTTHSMEEAEALCSRLGIMVGGRLRCIGSPQHLKARFGSGFLIDLKLRHAEPEDDDVKVLLRAVDHAVGGHLGSVSRSNLFEVCSALKNRTRLVNTLQDIDRGSEDDGHGSSALLQKLRHDSVAPSEMCQWWAEHDRVDRVMSFMEHRAFSGSKLLERHGCFLRFSASPGARLADIFELLEAEHEVLHVSEYSVAQTTLEMLFNSFAGQQEEESAPPPGAVSS